MNTRPVVLIEGLDLAGKSTLSDRLSAELEQRGVQTRRSRNALCPDNPVARLADKLRRDPTVSRVETGALFLAAHCWDAQHFQAPPVGGLHLQDSSWLRTLAFHTYHDTPGVAAQLRAACSYFPKFDAAIFLTASINRRCLRLAQRAAERPSENDWQDHLVEKNPDMFCAIENALKRATAENVQTTVVDTTDLSPEEVFKVSWQRLVQVVPNLRS